MNKHSAERESTIERAIAFVLCALVLLVPMVYIEHGYDAFTSEHGEAREGAAGAGLALAVVFRTVSRTVLRTIVRTSARAGVRASLKGAMKSVARNAKPKSKVKDPVAQRKSNWKSMAMASGLLYLSWLIVVGIGQPFADLLDKDASLAREAKDRIEHQELRKRMQKPAIDAYEKKQILIVAENKLETLRVSMKKQRDTSKLQSLEAELQIQKDIVINANYDFTQALEKANGILVNPEEKFGTTKVETPFDDWVEYLTTYAPFPGETSDFPIFGERETDCVAVEEKNNDLATRDEDSDEEKGCSTPSSWNSAVIWLGGFIMVLPLWVVFLVQSIACRRKGVIMDHQTEWIGGSIQLYFAGAFSFMPLTSDVIIDTNPKDRSDIALTGLLVPTLIAMILWMVWKNTHAPWILFFSDAFLLYPMVQVFPLDPLEGIHVWRNRKMTWLLSFILIMGMFLLVSSEALKSVI